LMLHSESLWTNDTWIDIELSKWYLQVGEPLGIWTHCHPTRLIYGASFTDLCRGRDSLK
jgi:hypothetical protein